MAWNSYIALRDLILTSTGRVVGVAELSYGKTTSDLGDEYDEYLQIVEFKKREVPEKSVDTLWKEYRNLIRTTERD